MLSYQIINLIIILSYIILYRLISKEYEKIRESVKLFKKFPAIDLKLTQSLRSLKILFLTICLLYAGRFIQYVITLSVQSKDIGNYLDPLIIALKAIMVTGICFSIQVKVRSENGNLQADVEIQKKAKKNSS